MQVLAASAHNCYLQLCCCCRSRIALSAPQKGQVYWRVSENTADGPLTYQREEKVMPHPGRVQGWAHRSRMCLHDLGHAPCHLSLVRCWGTGKISSGPQGGQWSDIGLGLACWSFTSHNAGDWSKMHFCLVQEELYCLRPCQGWGSISISWGERCCWRLSGGGSPAKPLASPAQGAEHMPPHRPLC